MSVYEAEKCVGGLQLIGGQRTSVVGTGQLADKSALTFVSADVNDDD